MLKSLDELSPITAVGHESTPLSLILPFIWAHAITSADGLLDDLVCTLICKDSEKALGMMSFSDLACCMFQSLLELS